MLNFRASCKWWGLKSSGQAEPVVTEEVGWEKRLGRQAEKTAQVGDSSSETKTKEMYKLGSGAKEKTLVYKMNSRETTEQGP